MAEVYHLVAAGVQNRSEGPRPNPSGGFEVLDGDGNTVTNLTAEEALTYMTQAANEKSRSE
jgi:hypothetical protein